MNKQMNSVCVLFAILIFGFFTQTAFAQDAAKVASANYKVEFENDQVRVLRVSLNPGEKSVMHEHPDSVVVSLTDGTGKHTFPDGTTQETTAKAGQVRWAPAVKHTAESTGDKPSESILIEIKPKPAITKEN